MPQLQQYLTSTKYQRQYLPVPPYSQPYVTPQYPTSMGCFPNFLTPPPTPPTLLPPTIISSVPNNRPLLPPLYNCCSRCGVPVCQQHHLAKAFTSKIQNSIKEKNKSIINDGCSSPELEKILKKVIYCIIDKPPDSIL